MARRICPSCGSVVDSDWKFCPSCGEEILPSFFSEFFGEFDKSFRKLAGMNFERLDATPMFSRNAGGFSIRVTRRGEEEPKVEVRTFGNVRPEDVNRQVEREMGVSPVKRRALPSAQKPFQEPTSKITNEGERVIVEISFPKVSSMRDIEITRLESSIEVRAYGKDEGYFKIIAIPEGAELVGKSFSGGVLRLELAKR